MPRSPSTREYSARMPTGTMPRSPDRRVRGYPMIRRKRDVRPPGRRRPAIHRRLSTRREKGRVIGAAGHAHPPLTRERPGRRDTLPCDRRRPRRRDTLASPVVNTRRLSGTPGPRTRAAAPDPGEEFTVRVLMIAPPGAGKGTQGALIATHFAVPHIATGDLLRDHVARGTDLGRAVKQQLDEGGLVPDAIVLDMVAEALTGAR